MCGELGDESVVLAGTSELELLPVLLLLVLCAGAEELQMLPPLLRLVDYRI